MVFTIADITQPYTPHPIKIADYNGANTMTFEKLYAPSIDPNPTNNRDVHMGRSRPGAAHPGYRTFGSFGSSANDRDISLTLPLVTPEALLQLQGYNDARPGVFLITVGETDATNAVINYFVMFKPNGLKPEGYKHNQRVFSKVGVELHVIQQTSQTFGG